MPCDGDGRGSRPRHTSAERRAQRRRAEARRLASVLQVLAEVPRHRGGRLPPIAAAFESALRGALAAAEHELGPFEEQLAAEQAQLASASERASTLEAALEAALAEAAGAVRQLEQVQAELRSAETALLREQLVVEKSMPQEKVLVSIDKFWGDLALLGVGGPAVQRCFEALRWGLALRPAVTQLEHMREGRDWDHGTPAWETRCGPASTP